MISKSEIKNYSYTWKEINKQDLKYFSKGELKIVENSLHTPCDLFS